jgi:hypothetical protein
MLGGNGLALLVPAQLLATDLGIPLAKTLLGVPRWIDPSIKEAWIVTSRTGQDSRHRESRRIMSLTVCCGRR